MTSARQVELFLQAFLCYMSSNGSCSRHKRFTQRTDSVETPLVVCELSNRGASASRAQLQRKVPAVLLG